MRATDSACPANRALDSAECRVQSDSVRKKIISSTPDVMGGAAVFAGTRVPVQTLMDYIEGGESIDDFLEGFPTVKRAQVIAFLEEAKKRMLAEAA